MRVDYMIIGQGISGTLLSWFLLQEGKTIVVIDQEGEHTPSKVAAGIINPVTGRRYAYTWMIDEVMPFAVQTYVKLGGVLGKTLVAGKSIIDFFPSPQMRMAFLDRLTENDTYLHTYPDQNHFNPYFNYDFGCGEVWPAYMVQMRELLKGWRDYLQGKSLLRDERFETGNLSVEQEGVRYGDIEAEKVIFCDGAGGTENPWFRLLPYAPNKGEALILSCPELERDHIFKKGLMLAPLAEADTYWLGSNYQWEFEHDQPSSTFYEHATSVLNGWLKLPYKVLDHLASVRPATLERRPFVGLHPQYPSIGLLNGMGTKGASLAPFFANQLTQHLVHGLPLGADADVHRFSRVLAR